MEPDPGEVTRLLHEIASSRRGANGGRGNNGGSVVAGGHESDGEDDPKELEERLIELVYKELRRLAASYLRKEAPDHTLQPTALVHEAYLRLTGMEQMDWQSRSHFFAVAAKVMRHVLVDHARSHQADKRGRGFQIVGLDDVFLHAPGRAPEILALDDALDLLAKLDPRQCQVVELRFFAGLTEEEIAQLLGIAVRTVKRDWRSAKAWLFLQLSHKVPNSNDGGVPLAL